MKLYRVTTESAAWLGPQRPSRPRPQIPVLPTGFLQKYTHTYTHMVFIGYLPLGSDTERIFED